MNAQFTGLYGRHARTFATTTIYALANVLRSNNAAPFWTMIDPMFDDDVTHRRRRDSNALSAAVFAG